MGRYGKGSINNCWGLAGGSLEPGETLEDVAKREMLEETGLTANDLQLFNIYSGEAFYYKYPHGDEVYNVVAAYICNNFDGELAIDEDEVSELRFFHVQEIPSNISPPDQRVIKDYIQSI